MSAVRTPYCIVIRRELSVEEKALLSYLLKREAPDRLADLVNLKVVARCGCGKCPTVLFGTSLSSEPITSRSPSKEIASYRGRNAEGVEVGVVLSERKGQLAELEAWAPVGGDILSWPPASALEKM